MAIPAALKQRLLKQRIETPSWGYQDSGTRFGIFAQPWAAKTLEEKFQDAGQVHKFTGICPTVALHIPWDKCDDWSKAKAMAASYGLTIGAINPNVFQDKDYQFGSICHRDERVRQKAVKAHLDCVDIAKATGSDCISLWYADGTNYPGQDDFRARKQRMQDCLKQVYAAMPAGMRMLIEYKFFEPAFYHTDVQDWGSSLLLCQKLGPQAEVLVDTGHHAQGTNIEHIVAILLDEGRLGGFHFNSRKYADDDLTVGSLNPYELFLIYNELIAAEDEGDPRASACAKRVAYMFDQCHTHKPTVEAILQSTIMVQEIFAKALLVDRSALKKARAAGDIVGAEEALRDAYNTDVRPMLRELRQDQGIDPEPLAAFRRSGYLKKAEEERTKKRAAAGQAAQTMGAGFPDVNAAGAAPMRIEAAPDRRAPPVRAAVLAGVVALALAYLGGYAWLRSSHARPDPRIWTYNGRTYRIDAGTVTTCSTARRGDTALYRLYLPCLLADRALSRRQFALDRSTPAAVSP